jgi:hypothetical protein
LLSQIAKASLRSNILIDFNCYIDTEVGLIRLIQDKYRDDKVFNIDKLNAKFNQIILSLIDRKDINPLSIIANENISEEDLADYYREFFSDEYDEILKRSVSTELKSIVDLLKSETGINITFLCEKENEKYILLKDNLNDCEIIIKNQDKVNYSNFTTFMFKYVTDDILNYIYPYKNYYFSTYMVNFDEQFNMIKPNIIDKIIYNGGSVEILDLYNRNYLEGSSN